MATVEQQQMMRSYEHRQMMREEYQRTQMKEVNIRAGKKERYGKENMLNLPRHHIYGKCVDFEECPIDYKCRNYNSTYVKCQNCILVQMDSICKKQHLHNPPIFEKMISRERIDLDGKND